MKIPGQLSTEINTASGLKEIDILILASGFDALTGAILKVDIRGVGGVALRDRWADGPRDYLGFVCADFPNFFMVNGPHCAAGNFVLIAEHMVDWIFRLIDFAVERRIVAIDTTPEAEDRWLNQVSEIASQAIASSGCDSWFNGGNIPGKRKQLLTYFGGQGEFAKLADGIAEAGYPGFEFTQEASAAMAAHLA
ncbi:hypothetical protein BSL82_04425 [Tardibacter chloracetimidivorans]|uniref:Cyclohexanone monooxygenase n=1 Tax=Tardibacter chloracetimidivorans TaxID=1921510 RepID=A0A1L3ZSS2_9SPHN|nr:hypothetical protein [Tardibacter chloracetimidivorans]API58649.1 hypothetical protein BSL82_04425 [Tardibacter chloracetimidivorans]